MNASPPPGLPWEEIVSVAVHDMRTPLSSMRTTLEIIRMLNSQCDRTSGLVEKLDRQVLELAGHLERLQNDPASYRR
jgi:signal transduction histidine kinase